MLSFPSRLRWGGLSLFLLGAVGAYAQTSMPNLNIQVASLTQEVRAMQREFGQVQLEQEQLRRDMARLQKAVNDRLAADMATKAQLDALATRLRGEMAGTNDALRETLIAEVTREVESLATQTQEALNALAGAIEGRPQVQQVVIFSDDYPRTGIPYTVKSGDTLSGIARANNSRVSWIRNANQLANDTIFAGQELFLPQGN